MNVLIWLLLFFLQQATKIKHSTPDKLQQRYSNADDDIFFDMDGLDCHDSNMQHITQSDDDEVDDDEDFGMLKNNIFSAIFSFVQICFLKRVLCTNDGGFPFKK